MVRSAVQMQGWHALALLGIGLWAPRGGRLADAARRRLFALGLLLFCGAVYSPALGGVQPRPSSAPVGGTLLMLGWLLLAASPRCARGDPRRLSRRRGARDSRWPRSCARRGVAIEAWHGRLALSPDPPVAAAWALDIWTAPREIAVALGQGARPTRCAACSATGPPTPRRITAGWR